MVGVKSTTEKKDFLESYYKQLRHYLVSDITSLKKSDDSGNDVGCGPYLLTTSSGIDFLGNLSCAVRNLKRILPKVSKIM